MKKTPSPFPFILSRAANEAVQTAHDSEHVNNQENNLIIGYLSAHMIFLNGQRPGNYNKNKCTMFLMMMIFSKRCYHKYDHF